MLKITTIKELEKKVKKLEMENRAVSNMIDALLDYFIQNTRSRKKRRVFEVIQSFEWRCK